ncbi:FAD binding domain-domain-containing protein [Aspergillus taichungensis]|uniref:FAD binding domain-domain-containing protein n=1 Tax=Aspergillus taichungensis TaxID=482145 RepID=A0A2J5HFM6_9EURO|nr:FAD binding domain-domain-containing protein [Aspergillus taichungensis]
MPKTDVLICGSGSAGLCAATWLARYGIPCKILERRPGPMTMGQADGVQCRTVEIFESFGVGEELLREAYHVLEVVFWADDYNKIYNQGDGSAGGGGGGGDSCGESRIRRTGRTADTQPGLSHQPHVILNQARINGLLIERMREWNGQEIDYGCEVKSVVVDEGLVGDPGAYPVRVTAEVDGDGGRREEVFEAKYVMACDGAHSTVRKALGYTMVGDSSDAVWGVMDMIPRTNFPDIRKKATIRSQAGNLLIIPREGDARNLTRFYIELPAGTRPKEVRLEDLQRTARAILSQYEIEFVETVWWSAYSIGQRLADVFHKDHRVFLAGDACHTHSPKAGQGMNVSLQDGYNMGWKLAHVLKGLAAPSLLETYVLERQKTATDLINFDRYFSQLFSSGGKASPEEFQQGFIQSGQYTAGLTARYEASPITSPRDESATLATKVVVGMRLPSAQVVRFCDSKPLQLMTALRSDGRWRVMAFVGDLQWGSNRSRLNALGDYLGSHDSPLQTFRMPNGAADSLIEPIFVGVGNRHEVELEQIPDCFYPFCGKNHIRDLHKLYYDDESYNKGHGHAYEHLGIDPHQGAVIIVRPDQYVSAVFRLDDPTQIGTFFDGFLTRSKTVVSPGGNKL